MFGTNNKNSYDHIRSDSWACWHVSTNLDTINCLMMPLVKFDAFSSLQNTKIKERNYIVDYSTLFLRGFKLHFQTVQTDVLFSIFLACSRLSDSGEGAKVKRHAKSWRGGKKRREKGKEPPLLLSPVSSRFIFVFVLSQFSEPDYLGAWNRLQSSWHATFQGAQPKSQHSNPTPPASARCFSSASCSAEKAFSRTLFLWF